jgi:hypothetical protein
MSPTQLEFIERKRRAAAGLGPIMPEQCACQRCAGTGTAVCHQCEGRGTNSGDVGAQLSQSERGIIQQVRQFLAPLRQQHCLWLLWKGPVAGMVCCFTATCLPFASRPMG